MKKVYNNEQINRLSEIYMGVGHIALASVVVPALIDIPDKGLLVLGLATAIILWIISVLILRRIR